MFRSYRLEHSSYRTSHPCSPLVLRAFFLHPTLLVEMDSWIPHSEKPRNVRAEPFQLRCRSSGAVGMQIRFAPSINLRARRKHIASIFRRFLSFPVSFSSSKIPHLFNPVGLSNLTGLIETIGNAAFAFGGLADIWKGRFKEQPDTLESNFIDLSHR